MYALALSLAITGFLKKNSLIISFIIKRTIGSKGIKALAMGLAIGLITRLAMWPGIGPVIRLRTKPATGLAMELESIEKFSIGPAIGFVGPKGLLPSQINIYHNHQH